MPKLYSVTDVAQTLKVSEQYLRLLIRDDKIEAEKVGKQWVIAEQKLQSYIKTNNIVIEPDDHPRTTTFLPDIIALSFFSGAMGLDIGMEQAGISPLLACELDKETRTTIHANRPDIALLGDIREYDAEKVREYARIPPNSAIDVIFGGPPCQAFSTAGKQKGFKDDRGNVFLTFINLAIALDPNYLIIENVRGLLSAKYPPSEGFPAIKGGALFHVLKCLTAANYAVSFELYNAANFGSPQIRERIVMICKKGHDIVDFLSPSHEENGVFGLPPWRTLEDAILDLGSEHTFIEFPEKRLQYYRMLTEGQNWRDLPHDIQPVAMGKSYLLPGGKTGFYRRLQFNRPSPTLVTHPAMPATDLCHPTEDRPLSIEEYRRIQGFPDHWIICGGLLSVYKQIGNAVPIPLGKAIGNTIIADMNSQSLPQYKNFPYSGYKNTNHIAFLRQMNATLDKVRAGINPRQGTLGLFVDDIALPSL